MNRIRRGACGGLAQRIERRQPPARASADRQRKSPWTYLDFPRMKHGRGLVAATDWTWTDQGFGLCAVVDWTWSRTNCGHGQFTDWTRTYLRTRRGSGLFAATDKIRSWSRTGHGHGYGQDMRSRTGPRPRTGCGHGHGLDVDCVRTRTCCGLVTDWT